MYDTREHNRVTIDRALGQIWQMVGGGYRPECLVAGFMDAENQRLLAQDYGIHVRNTPSMAIDFTRYDLKAQEPQGLQRKWSLMSVLNQKGSRA